MLKDLINKRDSAIKELETLVAKAKEEKRSLNSEELTKFNTIKVDIENLNGSIESERFLDEQKKAEIKTKFESEERTKNKDTKNFNLSRAINNFLSGSKHDKDDEATLEEGKEEFKRAGYAIKKSELLIPRSYILQMRGLTSSSAANWVRVNQGDKLSYVQAPILYSSIGASIYDGIEGGKLDLVSAASITATFATENTSHNQISISPGKVTLTPRFLPATSSFTREMLAQTSPSIQAQTLEKFNRAIDKAIDKEMFAQLSGLTAAFTGSCDTYAKIVTLEGATEAASTAFLSSFKGRSYWKTKSIDTGSGIMTWTSDNTVAGYPAYASPQAPNGLVVLGDMEEIAIGFFGGLIVLEDPYTNKSTGNVDFQVARLVDLKIANSAAFAISKNGSFL